MTSCLDHKPNSQNTKRASVTGGWAVSFACPPVFSRRAIPLGRIDGGMHMTNNSRARAGRNLQSRRNYNLPRNGNVLPRDKFTTDDVAKGQAEVLQGVFGPLKSPAKEMARDTGLSERACRNQIAGVNCMNLADFFNACQSVPQLAEWGQRMMGLSGKRQRDAVNAGMRAITLRIQDDRIQIGDDDA